MRQEYIIDHLRRGDSSAMEIAKKYCDEHPTEQYYTVLASTKNKLYILGKQNFIEKKGQKVVCASSVSSPNQIERHTRVKVWIWGLVV